MSVSGFSPKVRIRVKFGVGVGVRDTVTRGFSSGFTF